jgi:hypothetical protein
MQQKQPDLNKRPYGIEQIVKISQTLNGFNIIKV